MKFYSFSRREFCLSELVVHPVRNDSFSTFILILVVTRITSFILNETELEEKDIYKVIGEFSEIVILFEIFGFR